MRKVVVIIGTRPEAIKMAPIILEFKDYSSQVKTLVCSTGQHDTLLKQVLKFFSISLDYDLGLRRKNDTLDKFFARTLVATTKFFNKVNPDLILVHGDTASAHASAQAAYYLKIPIAHVEAGLRTFDIYNPFPEELHRQVISKLAVKHFAPTTLAKECLLNEGISENAVALTGNTVIDAVLMAKKALNNSLIKTLFSDKKLNRMHEIFDKKSVFVLVTLHRRENLGSNFLSISKALIRMQDEYPDCTFVVIQHPNPYVNIQIKQSLDGHNGILLVPPMSYPEMVYLMKECLFILTDSGGLQEEGPAFKKPVVVARSSTERSEGVSAGTLVLGGVSEESLFSIMSRLMSDVEYFSSFTRAENPYGDGQASVIIVKECLNMLEIL